jgi:hypothetical protein
MRAYFCLHVGVARALVLVVSNLRACGPLVYIDNERAKQLLYALDDHVWSMKITALEESAILSDFNFSSEDSYNSEEDKKIKCKKGDFTELCLIGKSSWNDSDFDVNDDLSFESLSSKVGKLENALCNQDKLFYMVFHENKRLNLELENSFAEISSLRSMHDDMSAKSCENYNMIMVNYADLWIVHTQVIS